MALTQAQIDAMGKQIADIQAQMPTLTKNVSDVVASKNTGLINQPTAPITNANPATSTPLGVSESLAYTAGQLAKDQQATDAQSAAIKASEIANTKAQLDASNLKWYQTNQVATPDINKITQDAFAQFGLTPQDYVAERKVQLAEIQSLEKQYADANAKYETYKANIEQQFLPESLGQKKLSYNEKLANIELGKIQSQIQYKQAAMALEQGDFQMASTLAQNSISNALKQYDIEAQQVRDTYTMNKDIIDSMGTQAQQAFQNSMAVIESQRADAAAKLNAQKVLSDIAKNNYDMNGGGINGGSLEALAQEGINANDDPMTVFNDVLAIAYQRGLTLTKKQQDDLWANISKMKPIQSGTYVVKPGQGMTTPPSPLAPEPEYDVQIVNENGQLVAKKVYRPAKPVDQTPMINLNSTYNSLFENDQTKLNIKL